MTKRDAANNSGDVASLSPLPALASERWRTTLIIEAEANEGFEDALRHAVSAARERFIGVSFSLPKSKGCPRVECRTIKVRRRRVANG